MKKATRAKTDDLRQRAMDARRSLLELISPSSLYMPHIQFAYPKITEADKEKIRRVMNLRLIEEKYIKIIEATTDKLKNS